MKHNQRLIKIASVVAAVVVVVLVVVLAGSGSGRTPPSTKGASSSPQPTQPATTVPATTTPTVPTVHVGQAVTDDPLTFVVSGVQYATTIGSDYFTHSAPAGSQIALVSVSVSNTGTSSASFSGSTQMAFDQNDNQLSPTLGDEVYLDDDATVIFARINPGMTVNVVIPFELPTTSTVVGVGLFAHAYGDDGILVLVP